MQFTPNYSLRKPDGSDQVYVDDFNYNAEIIDEELTKAREPVRWDQVIGAPDSLPASDVYAWAKRSVKPSYTSSEVGADPIGSAVTAQNEANAYTDERISDISYELEEEVERALAAEQTNADAIEILNGEGEGSVRKIVADAIAEIVGEAPESLDTLKEISDWIINHVDGASEINTELNQNATDISYHTSNKNNPHSVTAVQVGLGNVPNVTTNNQTPTFTQSSNRIKIESGEKLSVLFGKISKWLADMKTVAFTGDYGDLTGTPDIPTVNNAKLTIQKNGENVQTFTSNQSEDATANISVPTKVSELANDLGYLTEANIAGGAVLGVKGSSETEYRKGNVSISKDNLGLSNVENKSSATIRGELTSANVTNALGYTPLSSVTKDSIGLGSVANLNQSKAIKNITRSGTTFTATALDGTSFTFTQQDNNYAPTILTTTLAAGNTSLSFTNSNISSSTAIDVYTSSSDVSYKTMTVSGTTLTLTFEAQSSSLAVRVHLWNS